MKKTVKFLIAAVAVAFCTVLHCFGVNYTYDKNGRLTKALYSGGLEISYTYDKCGNIRKIKSEYVIDFEIKFDTDGGSEVQSIFAKPGEDIFAPAEPKRIGYKFLGWFADKNCTQKYNFKKMPVNDITLYAGWQYDENYDWYLYDTSAKLFDIHTEDELRTIETVMLCGDDFSGKTICLQNDIVLSSDWTPIGNEECKFNGTFAGNGYTISRITVNKQDGNSLGFFGSTGELSIIEKLKLADVNICGNDDIGAICGTNGGLIINCVVDGSVSGNANVGGIAGTNNGDIVNIQSNVDVTANDFAGKAVGVNNGNAMLCVLAGEICEFATDNFGMFTGYSSESGHEIYSVYLIEETSGKTMQAYGLNSIFDEEERWKLAYYFYYEECPEYPNIPSSYIAQVEDVYLKLNRACDNFDGQYKGFELLTWNEQPLNEENIPCTLNF